MKYFMKLDRLMAWVLFITMFLYFISGYGMTKGIFDSALATKIHNNFLPYIALTAFVIHTAYAIRLAFIRWKIWHSFGKYLWAGFYIFLIFVFIYVASFYSRPASELSQSADFSSASPIVTSTADSLVKTFTLDELNQYNGQNGMPAYVAVDGNVYDLSSVFKAGKHFSHYAGKELTNAFYSYHAKSALSKYPIVGQLVK